jgi:hypothetical protein
MLSLRRALFDSLLVTYLLLTAWAFFVTMTHIFPTGPLRPFVIFSYGMMAPYQGASDINTELVLVTMTEEGITERHSIDRYFPGLHGERNSRQLLEQFADRSLESLQPHYIIFLEQFLELARNDGRNYKSVRLYSESWKHDERGYEDGRDRGVERAFLTSYP